MCAGHYRLDNLCRHSDYNKMQSDDLNEKVIGLEPLRAKWEAFRWHVVEIDGHDFGEMETAFNAARETKGKPSLIIAHTIKGKGLLYGGIASLAWECEAEKGRVVKGFERSRNSGR